LEQLDIDVGENELKIIGNTIAQSSTEMKEDTEEVRIYINGNNLNQVYFIAELYKLLKFLKLKIDG
jgi:hypothetical protein